MTDPSRDPAVEPDPADDPGRPPAPPLSLGRARQVLPAVPFLRVLLDRLVTLAEADPTRRWRASAALSGVEDRQVDTDRLRRHLPLLMQEARAALDRRLEESVDLLERVARGEIPEAVDLLVRWAGEEHARGRLDDAQAVVDAALQVVRESGDRMRTLDVHLVAARVARARGRLDEARFQYEFVLQIAGAGGDGGRALTAAVGLGNLEVDRGRWGEAERRYRLAESLLQQLDGPRPEAWHLALNRCILAREEGALEAAWAHLERAEAGARALDDAAAVPIVENARGQLLLAMEDPAGAADAFRRALRAATAPDARVTIGVNLAEALLRWGREMEAGEVARTAEDEAIRAGTLARLPEVYRVLGEIMVAAGSPEAMAHFERALALVREQGLPLVERARILDPYARMEAARGNQDRADALRTEARIIRRTLTEGRES